MPDREHFIRMICEQPDEDGPRLVYADWLEDSAKPREPARAEFIRVQIKLATCRMCHRKDGTTRSDGYTRNCGRCVPGRRREQELFHPNARSWFPSPASLTPMIDRELVGASERAMSAPHAVVRRGFVASVSLTAADLLRHAPALFAAAPITDVRLVGREPQDFGPPEDGFRFGWVGLSTRARWDGPETCLIPNELYDIIYPTRSYRERHPTAALAHAALSAAAVAYGRSVAATTHQVECPRCKGQGKGSLQEIGWRGFFPAVSLVTTCPDCSGSGEVTRPGLPPLPAPEPAKVDQFS